MLQQLLAGYLTPGHFTNIQYSIWHKPAFRDPIGPIGLQRCALIVRGHSIRRQRGSPRGQARGMLSKLPEKRAGRRA